MRGKVPLAGSLKGRRRGHLQAVGHEGVAMASRKLLLARVAVVDENHEATSPPKDGGYAVHPRKRCQWSLDPLPVFGMNTVSIEKFVLCW
jgi:hypothetical protein